MALRPANLIIGPPGAGKGTLGGILNASGNFVHFAIGDAFRSLKLGTPEGDMHAEYVKQGKLLPDDFAYRLLIASVPNLKGQELGSAILILDGFPRTLRQLELLHEAFFVSSVAVVECSEEVLISRCLARAKQQGRIEESDESVVRKRLLSYYQQTEPLLKAFSTEQLLKINNEQAPEIGARRIGDFFRKRAERLVF